MLSNDEIVKEAQRRIKEMNPQEKKEMEDKIREGINISHRAAKFGYKYLTKEEKRKFHLYNDSVLRNQSGGGINTAEIENDIASSLDISREQIKNMKSNPYKASMLKQIVLAVLANLGIVAAYGISKGTGFDMSGAYPVLSGLSGLFSLGFANQLVKSVRFRHLQKLYDNNNYQEKEIEAAMFREIRDNVKKGMR